jgi:[acyl-carrier-protein] S-malonyltransferase
MKVALMFPGQGSQRPGMGQAWRGSAGWPLVEQSGAADLLLRADADTLKRPDNAQVSTYLASLLAWQALPDLEVVGVAGHSLGEYTALVAAGVLTAADGLALVRERGAAMQAAADAAPGTMAALLGADDETVDAVCADTDDVWPANYNAPGHVVVSGTSDGVATAGERGREHGVRRVLPIPVGGAYHTPLMEPARPRLEAALDKASYGDPRVPVVENADADLHEDDWPTLLSAQLLSPVRWSATVHRLVELGAQALVEVGPGGVLTGLARRIDRALPAYPVATPQDVGEITEKLHG